MSITHPIARLWTLRRVGWRPISRHTAPEPPLKPIIRNAGLAGFASFWFHGQVFLPDLCPLPCISQDGGDQTRESGFLFVFVCQAQTC